MHILSVEPVSSSKHKANCHNSSVDPPRKSSLAEKMFCIKKIKQKRNTIFWHSTTMHLYVLPEANMSSKTTVGNLPLRLPCFEIWFPEKGLWSSEGGRIYKQLLWKVAKKPLTQLSTAHRSKGWAVNSAGWGFYWLLHDFVWQEVGRSLCLEEVKGLLCFLFHVEEPEAYSMTLHFAYICTLNIPLGTMKFVLRKEKQQKKEASEPTSKYLKNLIGRERAQELAVQLSCQETQKKIWQINVTGMIKFISHWEGKGNNPAAKSGNRKRC